MRIALRYRAVILGLSLAGGTAPVATAGAAYVWVEAEQPAQSTMERHPWWYDRVKADELSGRDFISNWNDQPGEAAYRFLSPAAGTYEFWVRANPVGDAKLAYRLNDSADWLPIDLANDRTGDVNIAADDKPDLRFLVWSKVGRVKLNKGPNAVAFRMSSANNNHGMLDCFVFSAEPFRPDGVLKPHEQAAARAKGAAGTKGWVPFDPPADPLRDDMLLDLRFLNERVAGENGFIAAKGGHFVQSMTGRPVRFWAVNGMPEGVRTYKDALDAGRVLAKRGVNLVRHHGSVFTPDGEPDLSKVRRLVQVVEGLRDAGVYSELSIYFPLWYKPKPTNAALDGYDGSKPPFASLMFDPEFQQQYRAWWTAVLTTPSPHSGKTLADEPAVMGAEVQNEDSYFFWTFNEQAVPDPQLRQLEQEFGRWLAARYGSPEATYRAWGGLRLDRDAPAEQRFAFRPLWNLFSEKAPRDRDTARFLGESQRKFYADTHQFLRDSGFKGTITASNWTTANNEVLGPIEKWSYLATDFVDRHGYFGGTHKGDNADWSIRAGHTYADRSALRFDPPQPGKPQDFAHPVNDIKYGGKPSMISETTFTRPNRYRSEAPLFYAAYAALQDSDAVVHFALDGTRWQVKPNFFMQPWTLMSPAMMGQFPAAAMIYRRGLIATGDELARFDLKLDDVFDLKGTAMAQKAALDELRKKDVGAGRGSSDAAGGGIDPLIHYAGRTTTVFSDTGGPAKIADLSTLIDRRNKVVTSSTGEVKLDWGKGVLTIDAPAAQAVSGNLKAAGETKLRELTVASDLDLGHVVAVSLDGQPLASSQKILLQVMTEEQPTAFRTDPAGTGLQKIADIGKDPWLMREIRGTVRLTRPDATSLNVTALDANGYPTGDAGDASAIELQPATIYYLITPR
ncbi:MAG TPA: hypothetical protein VK324_06265 [Tepidisphaeraceae bacterium]|nr:hypothetical protein [Tepidisphaeraceae bacterium]